MAGSSGKPPLDRLPTWDEIREAVPPKSFTESHGDSPDGALQLAYENTVRYLARLILDAADRDRAEVVHALESRAAVGRTLTRLLLPRELRELEGAIVTEHQREKAAEIALRLLRDAGQRETR